MSSVNIEAIIRSLSEKELKILVELYKSGGEAMLKDVWRNLGIKSKMGMPSVNKLEKLGLVVKENVGTQKRVLYKARLTDLGREVAKALVEGVKPQGLAPIEVLAKIPCFYCPHLELCGSIEELSPEKCEILNRWLLHAI